MRLSAFNLYVPSYPNVGVTLVHNTFSGAFVELDDDTLAALRKADRGCDLTADELELVSVPDLRDPDVGIVVDSRSVEEQEFRAWFDRRRRHKTIDCILGVNLACNFECPYCSQGKILDGSVMTEDTADRAADWLAQRAVELGMERLFIAFVGGEPLLHPGRVKRIAARAKAQCDRAGIAFAFSLITNGYFMTPELVTELLPYGLESAKVTLDGDETTHSLTRVSKKGEDTFERIFDHILFAAQNLDLTVNGNYQDNTVHGFIPLVKKLAAAGLPRGTRIQLTPALAGLSSASDAGSGSCTWSGSNTDLHIAMQDAVLSHGYDPGGVMHAVGPCEFHDVHSFAMDPDGTIYKCPGFMGHPEWGIGHVASGLTDRYQRILSVNPQRECGSCAHRPNCGGGCIANEWLRNGRMEGVSCEHDFFERVIPESVPRSYLMAIHDTVADAVAAFPRSGVSLENNLRSNAPLSPPSGRRSAALRVLAA
jgi:uncharacterized protein